MREIYLAAFERIVTGCRPWTIMCSYNKVNGVSASENHWLLTTVLRDEWRFQGLVVSDWGAVYDRVPALAAGLDLEMPPNLPRSPDQIVAAVKAGELDEPVLDARARTVLDLVGRGMAVLELDDDFDPAEHHRLARAAAAESVVLLKNSGGMLPLDAGGRIAVIGEFARTPRFQGAGSSQVNPTRVENALDELTATFGQVAFAAGYGIGDTGGDDALRAEAARVAADADTVVMFLGLPAADESEGFDRTHLNLPDNQLAGLRAVAAVNPNVVVVLVNGSTVVLGDVVPHAAALVEAWLGGQAAGGAIADVLSGKVNPSGRLAETIPHRLADNSSYLNFPGDSQVVRYGEGLFVGYRGYDATGTDVAFPFGFGLSYTTFELDGLSVATTGSAADGSLAARVTVTVTNTGPVAGSQVQVYVRDVTASVARPVRELKGFGKVALDPGEERTVSITLDQRAFSFWSDLLGRWVVESGEFAIEVGSHSRDLPLSAVVGIDAPSIAPITAGSTLHEWMADPVALGLIAEAVAAGQPEPTRDPELVAVIGSMPMSTLAGFSGMSIDHDTLDELVERWRERRQGR
ncbi:MAG TPA: glycoside hydrolase family 3 C-terminal domain-containing protein [Nakamurella sp.]